MGSKVYEAPTLKAATKERAQHYEELGEQFVRLKKEFGKIVDDGQFQGHGAEAIKGFYQAQSDIVDAWLRFIDVNIEFFKSIPGYAEDANLAENTLVQVPFLEENVSQGLKSAKDSVADQQESLQNIFNGINDLVSLTVFSKDPFDEQMDQAEKKRTRTVEAVNAIDQQLTQEYLGLQSLVQQVNELYSAMINATRQGENISPLYFNAEAYKTNPMFQMQNELKTQAAGYVKQKRSERMPSAMMQLSQEAKVYTLKKEKGFFTEIWDNVQSGSGSALDDTVDGLVNMVKNPGETFDGLKYAAAHPIKTGSAAWDQLSTSFNEEVIHGDAGSRAHYFSYMGTQLGVSVLGGKGIDKLSKVSKVDLAKGMGKVKKHTYVVNKKSTDYLERFNMLFSKERLAADGFTIDVKDFDNVEEEMMVLQASKVREVEVEDKSKFNSTKDIYKVSTKDVYQALEGYEQIHKFTAQFRGFEVKAQRSLSHMSDKQLIYSFKKGYSPKDGANDTIILHHHEQKVEGPIIEIPNRNHDLGNKRQHPYGNSGGVGSGDARIEFNKWRKEYWKARYANEMISRGIIE
ncbi:MAG: T7SS effector LXG polymorphic toxin [Bacillota bacterium]